MWEKQSLSEVGKVSLNILRPVVWRDGLFFFSRVLLKTCGHLMSPHRLPYLESRGITKCLSVPVYLFDLPLYLNSPTSTHSREKTKCLQGDWRPSLLLGVLISSAKHVA